MHEPVQESPVCQDYAFRMELDSHISLYAAYGISVEQQFAYGILPDIQVRKVFQYSPPTFDETGAVALGARAPHGRPLAPVQHAELDGGPVRHDSHITA